MACAVSWGLAMTPDRSIAKLDAQIAKHGTSVSFRRGTGTPVASRGVVRGYKPEQLVGLIQQADRNLIVSPSSLGTFVPTANDQVAMSGTLGTVQAAEPIRQDGVVIRWNIRARFT